MATKTLITLEEFLALPDDGMRHELNEGELITMPVAAWLHSLVVDNIKLILSKYVYEKRIGRVLTDAGYLLRREPEKTVRQPDVSFVTMERVRDSIGSIYCEGAPELAVEVVSPGDSAEDLNTKVKQYLAAGAKEAWIVYPKTRSVDVQYADGRGLVFGEDAILTSDLFPGWSVRVAEFFDFSA